MKKMLLILLLISNANFAQSNFSIDTSYTEKSVYTKLIKKYPFITIPQLKEDKTVVQVANVVYQDHKERPLHLDAFFYKKEKQNPAVLLIHGGGWKSGNKNQMHILAQKIAAKGYSCFAIEYRLSLEAKYPEGVIDVKNAIKFIKDNAKKFNVDPDKIAVLGCSSGAQMAALIGTTNENLVFEDPLFKSKASSKVNAIINIDGILAFKHPESSEGEMASFWLNGTYEEKPEIWKKASALSHTDKTTPPILFINSSIDRFHAGRDDMIKILDQNKIYSEIHTIKESPHSFWFFEPWLAETVLYSTQFLDKIFKIN
ncbi:alpha/beta hydrolase [Flavobacterium sp. Fl-77]|uniref:Alpha/beta hydrolase n=1 Tax=Flavobacterium flavipigmentatum TaxID=2893884 RepID=A0AAJ2SFY9_9FLAO|nr:MULTISPECIES: alpha/beta hydrolase [unclassified Flavobacterium]MDX6183625.1 alpha/beta hydrolase [Flavobacterium sp. Fl-33]MDX6187177.1 alpha/beta hydrolase [Flavobacterium sp. Fl-77]UFH38012.1 alpha/beta hydrolase [Flavobacterium sp. F-70]